MRLLTMIFGKEKKEAQSHGLVVWSFGRKEESR
jgi:hypothetical protein